MSVYSRNSRTHTLTDALIPPVGTTTRELNFVRFGCGSRLEQKTSIWRARQHHLCCSVDSDHEDRSRTQDRRREYHPCSRHDTTPPFSILDFSNGIVRTSRFNAFSSTLGIVALCSGVLSTLCFFQRFRFLNDTSKILRTHRFFDGFQLRFLLLDLSALKFRVGV